MARATLVVEQSIGNTLSNVPGTTSIATWSVQVGDVIVFSGAHNKGTENLSLSTTSGDGAAIGTGTEVLGSSGAKSEVEYYSVTSAGTLDLSLVKDADAYTTYGLYLLRSDYGAISVVATDSYVQGAGSGISSMTNSYALGSPTNGVLIEGAASYASFSPLDPNMIVLKENSSSAPKRVALYRSFSGLSSIETTYSIDDSSKQTALAGVVFSSPDNPTPSPTPFTGTNILFIAIDDMKPIIGAYGNTLIQTPNMDELASAGTVFLNNHCQWAVCGPSRASIMTSLMPEESGVMGFVKMRHNDDAQLHDLVTLPQHFKNNGFETAATGKINDNRCVGTINPDGTVNNDGSTYDDPPSWSLPYVKASSGSVGSSQAAWAHDTGTTVKRAAESVDAPDANFPDGEICTEGLGLLDSLATGNKPFFLGVGFKKPHLPFLAPKQYWDLYQRDDFTVHPHQTGILNQTAYTFNNVTELRDNYYMETDGQGYALQLTSGILPDDIQKELLHGYYASISFVDAQVGLLMDKLVELGLDTNTIVVLWGDHGFHLGDHNEWGKHTNLEQATRSPMIIYSPWEQGGQATQSPTTFLDIYPTLCEMAGLSVPEQPLSETQPTGRPLRGKSLTPILADPSASVRTGAISQYGSGTAGYAYRTERYRYIEWINSSGVIVGQELYDYDTDPMETTNLAYEVTSQNMMYDFSVLMRTPGEADGADRLVASAPMAVPTNSVPVFSSDPVVEVNALADSTYAATLADNASDADGNQNLVFTKIYGPEWLSVAADGTLSGTPTDMDVGLNSWTVQVDDTFGGRSTATLEVQVNFGGIPAAEFARIEAEFGITLTAQEKADLETAVNPATLDQWRLDAYERIKQNRMAYLDLQVVDNLGAPLEGAQVSIKLKNHAFKWAGTLGAKDMYGAGNSRISTETYQNRAASMFNSVGLNNGFKPRLTGIHSYLPDLMSWAQSNNIPVRGHLLLWPGTGDIADLDDPQKVSGVDYGGHLSQSSTSDYAHYNVLGAVETYKASPRAQSDVDAVEAEVDAEIAEWAGTWDVYEWDVINETLGNKLLMQIMGYDQMAEWFRIARTNVVDPNCKLMINDYQIISSMSENRTPGWYAGRRDELMANIDQIIADGGPIDGIGFQSRYKQERRDPQILWDRLKEWGDRYGLMMVGTEFEVVSSNPGDWKEYIYTDMERAQITDEMMTQYFSHPLVTGFTAWNFMHDEASSLVDYDGLPKLNGLVWYYLHRIRYSTDETSTTDAGGWTSVHGFLGDYDIVVTHQGTDYPVTTTLSSNKAVQIELSAVNNPPVWDISPYTAQDAPEDAAYSRWINWVASDIDTNDTLTFSMVSGPGWVSLSSAGKLTGTPEQVDVGTNMLQVTVSDGVYAPVPNTVYIPVINVNDDPVLLVDPIVATNATEGVPYADSINGSATDEDGDALSYSKVSGPAWLSIASDGALSGTPASTNNGLNSFMVQVDDGNGGAITGSLSITVDAPVNLPPAWSADPFTQNSATEDAAYTNWINWRVTDPESDPVTFVKVTGPEWLTIANAATGKLVGTPTQSDVGVGEFVISVSDGINPPVEATMNLEVLNINDAPVFSADPITTSNATENSAYSDTIAGSAIDEDVGETLTYSKDAGDPAWLVVAGDGTLSGTPGAGGVGLNVFTITVDDGNGGSDTATLNITVDAAPTVPEVVFSDNFELSADWTSEWSAYGAWARTTARNHDGSYSAEIDGSVTDSALVSRSIDVTAKSSATITFWWYIEKGLDTGEYLAFDVDTGSGWVEMATRQGNVDQENSWASESVPVDVSGTDTLTIRFRGKMNNSREDAYVDQVEVVAQ
jgi:arylsulfatase A-like enzyme/GH35 family endo-1,4-beta-xylanase